MEEKEKVRAGRNRTIVLTDQDRKRLKEKIVMNMDSPVKPAMFAKQTRLGNDMQCKAGNDSLLEVYLDKTINSDLLTALPLLPDEFADLIIIDPPYNLTKNFGGKVFNERNDNAYEEYLNTWFPQVCRKLKPNGSLYMCGDWKCTAALQRVIEKELTILNRITWQREYRNI